MDSNAGKVVTLETLGAAIQKIEKTYPTREEVKKEITDSGGGVTYATEEEVLALFGNSVSGDEGEEGTT